MVFKLTQLIASCKILNHFEKLNPTLVTLKTALLEQLNSDFYTLSARFHCIKIDYLVKQIGI